MKKSFNGSSKDEAAALVFAPHQMSVDTELATVSSDPVLDTEPVLEVLASKVGSQALRLSSAWFRMEDHVSRSSRESADNRCLMIVEEPCLMRTRDSLSSRRPGLRLSSRKVCIREQISLGAMLTVSVTQPPRSIVPMGS